MSDDKVLTRGNHWIANTKARTIFFSKNDCAMKRSPNDIESALPHNLEAALPSPVEAYLYDSHEVPHYMNTPFILSGYRLPEQTPVQCILSIFRMHNETVMIVSLLRVCIASSTPRPGLTLELVSHTNCHTAIFLLMFFSPNSDAFVM